jgi:hypothetical protein
MHRDVREDVAGAGGEAVKVLEDNQEQLYEIVEMDDGTVVLKIVLGTIGWYEMYIPLTPEELTRYREEGRSFLRWFIDRVRDKPSDYRRQ